MSIEWLLVKNKDSKAQQKNTQHNQKEEKDDQKIKRDEESSSVETQKSPNELKLHCDCGFEGIFSMSKADFEFLGEDNKGYAYFQCTNCTRHLRYDISTGKTKIKKGVFGNLHSKPE